jgi:hypothetical protein
MKVAQIQDIGNLADGSVIGEMRVQVKAAFPPKVGEGKYGPWRVQACILKDVTGEVRASFWGPDDMQPLVGQTITIKSQATNKGLQGINVQYSKHSDTNEIKVTDKAAIIDDAQNAVQTYANNVPAAPRAVAPRPAQSSASTGISVEEEVIRRGRLYMHCYAAAKSAQIKIEQSFGTLAPEHFQALVSSLFISADRAGLHQHLKTPIGQTVEPAAPAQPEALEPQDEIPGLSTAKKVLNEFEAETGW